MRAAAGLIVLTILACALMASNAHKPFELRIDGAEDARPAAWPTYAARNRVEMSDQFACMRLVVPYSITSERPKGVTRT